MVCHDFVYGTPSAAGGRIRPMAPATITIVAMYGSMARNWDGISIGVSTIDKVRCSDVVKANRKAAPVAPSGVQRPKITAARAMNPRPAVMSELKAPTAPMLIAAPAKPAIAPANTRFQNRNRLTSMPAVSAALGCSPTERAGERRVGEGWRGGG